MQSCKGAGAGGVGVRVVGHARCSWGWHREGPEPKQMGARHPSAPHFASRPRILIWSWPGHTPAGPMAPQFCTLGSLAPKLPAPGSSGPQLIPSLFSPPLDPRTPAVYPSWPPCIRSPHISPLPDPQSPVSSLHASSPHLSLTPAPSAPRSRAPGFLTPRSPRALPATPPLGAPRAAPGQPRPFPVPTRCERCAGAVKPWAGGGRTFAAPWRPPDPRQRPFHFRWRKAALHLEGPGAYASLILVSGAAR